MSASFKKLQPEEYLKQHYEQDLRPDGREGLSVLRPVSISVGSITTADGSAVVKQGQTVIVCGVKLELAEPVAERPKEGYIVPNLSLPALCHSQFKPGAPAEQAQTASQFLKEVLANSNLINLEDLCIQEAKWAWTVYIDLSCLNFGGNILDASVKALTAALRNVRLPKAEVAVNPEDDSEQLQVDAEDCSPLKLGPSPLSCTVAVFGDRLLVDPTDEEEELADANVTVVMTADNKVCHVHKPGGQALSPERLQQCIGLAKKQAKHIQKLIDTAAPVQDFEQMQH